MPSSYRQAWGQWVVARLQGVVGDLRGRTVEIHASQEYVDAIRGLLLTGGADVRELLRGLNRGERLAWYGNEAVASPLPRATVKVTDPDTGEIVPITLVSDNGGRFRSFRFGTFITGRPELRHILTRVRTAGQNGVRERAFQSLKYERLYREQIDDATDLVREADIFRVEFNTVRPHEALFWNRPSDIHVGRADPATPAFPEPEILPSS